MQQAVVLDDHIGEGIVVHANYPNETQGNLIMHQQTSRTNNHLDTGDKKECRACACVVRFNCRRAEQGEEFNRRRQIVIDRLLVLLLSNVQIIIPMFTLSSFALPSAHQHHHHCRQYSSR